MVIAIRISVVAIDPVDPSFSKNGDDAIEQLRMGLQQPPGALRTTLLFVGYDEQDQVSGQLLESTIGGEKGLQMSDTETLVVERAAAMNDALGGVSVEGSVSPTVAGRDNIGVVEQNDTLVRFLECVDPCIEARNTLG